MRTPRRRAVAQVLIGLSAAAVLTFGFAAAAQASTSPAPAAPKVTAKTLTAAPTPMITGTAAFGSTLTGHPGTWSPAPVTLTYQWLRAGAAISGATKPTYALAAADLGQAITLRVTGAKTGYTTVAKTSKATAAVKALAFTTAPTPTISGTVAVDATLTAKTSTWSPAATLSYQWKLNGTAISGATKSTFTPTFATEGGGVTVTVTGKRTGYTSKATTSAAVKIAAPTQLRNGETLPAGKSLRSPSGKYTLVMQADGNLVESGPSGKVWASNTAGSGGNRLVLASDGNLVIYTSAGASKWTSGTNGYGSGVTLAVQDDGNVVLSRAGSAIWTKAVVRWLTVAPNAKSGSKAGTQSMSGPTLLSTQYGVYAPGTRVPVVCGTTSGQGVAGAYTKAKDPTWHRLLKGDWVPDADFLTGTNGRFAGEPDCTPAAAATKPATKLDAYVAAHPSGSQVGDGQCVTLVKDYLTQVWGQDADSQSLGYAVGYRSGGTGGNFFAAHGWTWSTDQNLQPGDVIVWGAGAYTGSVGHVAIYYPHGSTKLYAQNGSGANALHVFFGNYFTSGYLGHWHHK